MIPVDAGFLNYVQRAPLGVVGQVVPWNFPLMFTSWKIGPALAAGNTVVLKPAEITPLTTLKIAELIQSVGIPPGVVNVVPGYGHIAGQHLAEHPDVHKIAFTGSTATGRRIVQASAGNLKRVQLELGGKGANVVFEDANLAAAVNGSAFAIFHNQGQACIAGSRLLLQESIAEEFLERFIKLAASIRLGDPLDPATEMGPLTSLRQQQSVLSYCGIAREQGGHVQAYINLCPHFALPLNTPGAGFLAAGPGSVMCVHHCAVFRYSDGLCIDGPAAGRSLAAIPVSVIDGVVYAAAGQS